MGSCWVCSCASGACRCSVVVQLSLIHTARFLWKFVTPYSVPKSPDLLAWISPWPGSGKYVEGFGERMTTEFLSQKDTPWKWSGEIHGKKMELYLDEVLPK